MLSVREWALAVADQGPWELNVDESKQNMVFGDECKDGTGIGNTGCNGKEVLLKTWVSSSKLIR
jgi:hypothetical protein